MPVDVFESGVGEIEEGGCGAVGGEGGALEGGGDGGEGMREATWVWSCIVYDCKTLE